MEVFKIENFKFTYPLAEKKALDCVSFTVENGEFVVLCGKSGCGKTTLLRHLKPAIAPNGEKSGEIFFEGRRIDKLDLRTQTKKIGFIMQNADAQIVCDKVWKELAFGLENLGMSAIDIRIRVAEVSAFFGLEDIFHKNIFELSGGQKQLLNLAAVMAMDPEVLVLDEPTSQLDPIAAQKLLDTLVKINRDLGVTVIISEHNLEGILEFSDKVVVMEEGRIAAETRPEKIAIYAKKVGLLNALPIAMQVFAETEASGIGPISVCEGRRWLCERVGELGLPVEYPKLEPPIKQTVFSMENIWYRYQKDSGYVLKGFSAKIGKGEIYSIIGGNAAGKTTLLKLAMGLLKPERGRLYTLDKTTRVGLVPQNPRNMFVGKTLIEDFENIEKDTEKVNEVARICEIEGLMKHHPFDLSGGELQRAAIAKILLKVPDVLFLDEPTKGMDSEFKEKFKKLLDELKNGDISVVIVTHDLDFCAKVSDRCCMLFDGQNLCEAEPRRFFADKRFYTSAASRMAKGIIPDAITDDDILNVLNKKRRS